MANLTLSNISKAFGAAHVLRDVSLDVRDGAFLTLVGASGCGKSTILRVIVGLEPQDAGTVQIGGREVDHLRPKQRNVAMVFQSYALYPHMSVAESMSTPLVMQRLNLAERLPLVGRLNPNRRRVMTEIAAEVDTVAKQLQIEAFLARKPAQLSGGQRQRVALGRSMVRHPDVFLMDEPLSNLDAKLRVHTRTELTDLHRRLGVTFIYVTHDKVEAMTMSDRVALMDGGRVVRLGVPSELYHNPTDLRVARFIGSPQLNIVSGTTTGDGVVVGDTLLPIKVSVPRGQVVSVGLRPEALSLDPVAGRARMLAKLGHLENLGAEIFLHFVRPDTGAPMTLRATLDSYKAHRRRLGNFDNSQMAMPFNTSTPIFFFNAELVKQAGGDPENFPTTWDGVFELATKIDALGDDIDGFFTANHTEAGGWFWQALVYPNGGEIMDAAEKAVAFGDDKGLAALALTKRFVGDAKMNLRETQQGVQQAYAGKTGILVQSTASLLGTADSVGQTFTLRTARYPLADMTNGRLPTGGNALVMLSTDEAKKDAMWRFAKWVSGPEGQTVAVKFSGYMPTSLISEQEQYPGAFYKEIPNYTTSVGQIPVARKWFGYPGKNSNKIIDIQCENINLAMRGEMPVADVLAKMVADPQGLI